jgi:hypothetical protein
LNCLHDVYSILSVSASSFAELIALSRDELNKELDLIRDPVMFLESSESRDYGVLFVCFEANKRNIPQTLQYQRLFDVIGTEKDIIIGDNSSFLTKEGKVFLSQLSECLFCLETHQKYDFDQKVCNICMLKYVQREQELGKTAILHPRFRTPFQITAIRSSRIFTIRERIKLFWDHPWRVDIAIILSWFNILRMATNETVLTISALISLLILINGNRRNSSLKEIASFIVWSDFLLLVGYKSFEYMNI